MATGTVECLPPPLDATAELPPIFDGTTRLYISYTCPFAQRVWITRNYKGLQDKIKLVPLNLQNRPAWYKEKVYPVNKVPALEHNGKVIGESIDLIKCVDSNFEGPSLVPNEPNKKAYLEELLSHVDKFVGILFTGSKEEDPTKAGAAFDHLEDALKKFDGPFLLGCEFSLADIAYIPFVERFQIFLSEVYKYDITAGRPKLAAWIEISSHSAAGDMQTLAMLVKCFCTLRVQKGLQEVNKIDGYTQTKKTDPKELVQLYKKMFSAQK